MSEEKNIFGPDSYAVVEVMGHNTYAGKIGEAVFAGASFVRVDVPELPERREPTWGNQENVYPAIPGFTKLIGAASIYAITPCSETVARQVAERRRMISVDVLDLSVKTEKMAIAAGSVLEEDHVNALGDGEDLPGDCGF